MMVGIISILPAGGLEGADAPQDGDRVVFFGDSITQSGGYVIDIEFFLMTRFPDRDIEVLNRGISSETISGTSEPDHSPRRPDAHDRFDRDVKSVAPDLIVACFGMNDGNYHPFDRERFRAYRDGVRRLIDRADEIRATVHFITPPPFDDHRRQVADPAAIFYGYRHPYSRYDDVLARYGHWLLKLRTEGHVVADAHWVLNAHLQRRRAERVSFFLASDAVHPNKTGHWLMAESLLEAWEVPGLVAEASIDAKASMVIEGEVESLQVSDQGLGFRWRSPLPMVFDPEVDRQSLALEGVSDRFNRYRLQVSGLKSGNYRLLAGFDESGELAEVAACSSRELENGLDLTTLPEFPTVLEASRLRADLERVRRQEYRDWRASLAESEDETKSRMSEVEAEFNQRRLPRVLQLRVVRDSS